MQRPRTFSITGHVEYGPQPLPALFRLPAVRMYACITCTGAQGDTVVLIYLRPDSVYPEDVIAGVVSPRNSYDSASRLAVIYRKAWEYSYDVAMLNGANPVYAQVDSDTPSAMRVYADFAALPVTQDVAPDLTAWLTQNPRIGWQMSSTSLFNGQRLPYRDWPPPWQAEVVAAFQRAWNCDSGPWPNLPANKADWDVCPKTVLDEDCARQINADYLGFMLAMEIGRRVPWSLLSYTDDQLHELFTLFDGLDPQYGGANLGLDVLPAAPSLIYSFLVRNGLVGPTTLDTSSRVLDWCRRNLTHFNGQPTGPNMVATWGYRGYPPVERVIRGTTCTTSPELGTRHWTAGCGGTTDFLRCVLKILNIPVRRVQPDGHAAPWFMVDDLYLSHGDDPYDQNSQATPGFAAAELLISPAAYDAWFGAAVPDDQKLIHVSQQPVQLAVRHLPDYLLHLHASDQRNHLAPADSTAYTGDLQRYYPDITALGELWTRMDARLRAMGGLLKLPVSLPRP